MCHSQVENLHNIGEVINISDRLWIIMILLLNLKVVGGIDEE